MAHSQILVVIPFSMTFEMDVDLVRHWFPFGNVCFCCHLSIAVYHFCELFRYVIVCFFLFVVYGCVCCVAFRVLCFVLQFVISCLRLFVFLMRGLLHLFCYRLLLFVVAALFCLLSFASVRSCVGLHRLLLGN